MTVLEEPVDLRRGRVSLSLEKYLALPGDTRAEIMDGVLRPMTRESHANRTVQRRLANALEALAPPDLFVLVEEIVVLTTDPVAARIPDVVVRPVEGLTAGRNDTPARDVMLAVEIFSPSTPTADLREKPVEYAEAGIASFWQVQLKPAITVTVNRLVGSRYQAEAVFSDGETVVDSTLTWVAVEVTPLLRGVA